MAQNGTPVDKTTIGTTIMLIVALLLGMAGYLKPSTMPSQDEIYQVLQTQIGSSISSLAKLCTQYVAQIDTYACWARGNDSKLMDYNTNSTYMTSEAIGNTTSGTVFLQDITFNYSLTIPQHVSVTDSINGSERTYGNVLDSTGSPYTISVDSRVSGYYMAQDASLKYVNSWSSTNANLVINNTINALPQPQGGSIVLAPGVYPVAASTYPGVHFDTKTNILLEGAGPSSVIFVPNSVTSDGILIGDSSNIIISNLKVDANKANNINIGNDGTQNCIDILRSQNVTIENCYLQNSFWHGVTIYGMPAYGGVTTANGTIVTGNHATNVYEGVHVGTGAFYTTVSANAIKDASAAGIQFFNCSGGSATGNVIYNAPKGIWLDANIYALKLAGQTVTGNTFVNCTYKIYNAGVNSYVDGNSGGFFQVIPAFWTTGSTGQKVAQAGVVNQTWLTPIYVPISGNVTEFEFWLSAGTAGSTIIASIYADNDAEYAGPGAYPRPDGGSLLWNTTASAASATVMYVKPNIYLGTGWYWLGLTTNATTDGFYRTGGDSVFSAVSPNFDAMDGVYFTQATFAPLPTTCPATTDLATAREMAWLVIVP